MSAAQRFTHHDATPPCVDALDPRPRSTIPLRLVYELVGGIQSTIFIVLTFTAIQQSIPRYQLARVTAASALVPELDQLLDIGLAGVAVISIGVLNLLGSSRSSVPLSPPLESWTSPRDHSRSRSNTSPTVAHDSSSRLNNEAAPIGS